MPLVSCLSQMLASPKDHVPQLTMLFERLVETTLGVTKEEMSQPVFAGLGCLTYPELHDVRACLSYAYMSTVHDTR